MNGGGIFRCRTCYPLLKKVKKYSYLMQSCLRDVFVVKCYNMIPMMQYSMIRNTIVLYNTIQYYTIYYIVRNYMIKYCINFFGI